MPRSSSEHLKGERMQIGVACDHGGFELKEELKPFLKSLGAVPIDMGTFSGESVDYPDFGVLVAEKVSRGELERGILICGTGIGMCIAANKVPGAYAALCSDPYSTERSRKSNNANIMTLGAQVIGVELAKTLVTIWMNSEYVPGGRSEPKVQRICEYAKKHQI